MISNKLMEFIVDFFTKRNLQLDKSMINSKLEVYSGFGIHDLDIDLFMAEFIKKFEVDDSDFDRKKYFGTGIKIIDENVPLIKKVFGKSKWLPLEKENREPFTLEILDRAIITKKLT